MHLHIDGDIVKYRCGFAAEKTHYTVADQVFTLKKEATEYAEHMGVDAEEITAEVVLEPVENALYNVRNVIDQMGEILRPDGFTIYLSGKENYRNSVGELIYKNHPVPGYKANRKDARRPAHGEAIVEYLIKNYPV
jgi:hypothetical protein